MVSEHLAPAAHQSLVVLNLPPSSSLPRLWVPGGHFRLDSCGSFTAGTLRRSGPDSTFKQVHPGVPENRRRRKGPILTLRSGQGHVSLVERCHLAAAARLSCDELTGAPAGGPEPAFPVPWPVSSLREDAGALQRARKLLVVLKSNLMDSWMSAPLRLKRPRGVKVPQTAAAQWRGRGAGSKPRSPRPQARCACRSQSGRSASLYLSLVMRLL